MSQRDDLLLDSGLSHSEAGISAAQVYLAVSGQEIDITHPAWEAVAAHAATMYAGADEQEVAVTVPDFAAMLRRAFARASDVEGEIPDYKDLPLRNRIAWETVGRHLANVLGMDQEEIRRLDYHQERIVAHALLRLGGSITLRSP